MKTRTALKTQGKTEQLNIVFNITTVNILLLVVLLLVSVLISVTVLVLVLVISIIIIFGIVILYYHHRLYTNLWLNPTVDDYISRSKFSV